MLGGTQLYDESLAAYDCLLGEGYRPTPPVSRAVFTDAYRDGRAPQPSLSD